MALLGTAARSSPPWRRRWSTCFPPSHGPRSWRSLSHAAVTSASVVVLVAAAPPPSRRALHPPRYCPLIPLGFRSVTPPLEHGAELGAWLVLCGLQEKVRLNARKQTQKLALLVRQWDQMSPFDVSFNFAAYIWQQMTVRCGCTRLPRLHPHARTYSG